MSRHLRIVRREGRGHLIGLVDPKLRRITKPDRVERRVGGGEGLGDGERVGVGELLRMRGRRRRRRALMLIQIGVVLRSAGGDEGGREERERFKMIRPERKTAVRFGCI